MTSAVSSDYGLGWCLIRTFLESSASGKLVLADNRRLCFFPTSQVSCVASGMALASPKAAKRMSQEEVVLFQLSLRVPVVHRFLQ